MDLQHRGQLSAGITTYDKNRKRLLQTYKDNGKVDEVFKINHKFKYKNIIEKYAGYVGIGHTRYATSGDDSDTLAQPFERPHGRLSKWFSLSYNGNLANYDQLKSNLENVGYNMTYDSDTEVIMHHLSRDLQENNPHEKINFRKIFNKLTNDFDGSYNICFVNAEGKFCAIRDPRGFKPLSYGIKDDLLIVASESVVLSNLKIDSFDFKPGELLIADENGYDIENYAEKNNYSHCFFEWIYFAHNASNFDGNSVYSVREKLGETLAKEEQFTFQSDDWIVVPVPDTSYIAGSKYASTLNLPYIQGITKNHQIGRTFIENNDRSTKVRQKFTFIKDILKNKRIILVDDSIVRGTTLKELVKILKDWCDVKEVHLRIACPPISSPCFYGIDFPTVNELYAGNKIPNYKDFCADSLFYLTYDGLISSLNKNKKDLCTACLNGIYPTQYGQKRYNNKT